MKSSRTISLRSALLLGLTAACAFAQQDSGHRVAAVINAGEESRALIEDRSGEQSWFRVGERLGNLTVTSIDNEGIIVNQGALSYRLFLQGDSTLTRVNTPEPAPIPREQSRNVSYASLMSQIAAVDRQPEETEERAVSRHINDVLGLAIRARITEVDRIRVASASEARSVLMDRLAGNDPIRIRVEDDYIRMLYVVPES